LEFPRIFRTPRPFYRIISAEKASGVPVSLMCELFGVSQVLLPGQLGTSSERGRVTFDAAVGVVVLAAVAKKGIRVGHRSGAFHAVAAHTLLR
jgi:hypothetical protein